MSSDDVRQLILGKEGLYSKLTKGISRSAFGVWEVATPGETFTVVETL